jgi:hypothetical protein
MAAAISLILEVATYLADEDASGAGPSSSKREVEVPRGVSLADPAAVNGAANWDLCTVAVYTCQANCCPGAQDGAPCWVEEQCVLVNEDDCHTDNQRL